MDIFPAHSSQSAQNDISDTFAVHTQFAYLVMAAAVASPLQPVSNPHQERAKEYQTYNDKAAHYYARVADTKLPESNGSAAAVG